MGDGEATDRLIQEAKLRAAVADAEKAEAQARKARYEARASEGGPRPAARSAADDKPAYPATLAAYQAMVRQAGDIAGAIERHLGAGEARLLIVDTLDFCGPDVQAVQVAAQLDFWLAELETWTVSLDRILQQLADKLKQERAAALAAAGSVAAAVGAAAEMAGLAADVVGYFRAGYDVRDQAVGPPDAALQALVAGRLDRQKCSVFLPAFHRLEDGGAIPVVEKLSECIRRKDRLKQQVAGLRGLSAAQEAVCKRAEQVIGEFAGFNEALTAPPRGGGYPPLVAAAMRHHLDRARITHLLYLGVTSSGGDSVTARGLLGSGKAGYLGGCVITYVLARTSGEIVAADTVAGHSTVRYELGANRLTPSEPG